MTTKTTIGDLIANLFTSYERRYHDEQLAALATQVTVDDMLRARCGRAQATKRANRKAA